MGNKPTDEYSINRIDNNGNYEKSNCQWSKRIEQERNKRSNTIQSMEQANEIGYLYSISKYNQKELAEIYDCSIRTISHK